MFKSKDEYVFDEKGNIVLTLREESWYGKDFKLSLRKNFVDKDGELTPNKGFAFLTKDGPNLLAEELVRRGYGNTKELVKILKDRDDIDNQLEDVKDNDDEYFDMEDLFGTEV